MSTLVLPAKLLGHVGVFANIAGPMWALSIRPHPAILLMVVGLLSCGVSLMVFQRLAPPARSGGRHPWASAAAAPAGPPLGMPPAQPGTSRQFLPAGRHLRPAGRHARHQFGR